MPHTEPSVFIVLECQKPPKGNNKHVIIPKSWIKCELGDNKVAIVYPSDEEARIEARVRDKQPPDDSWRFYIGEIKCKTDSYEYAMYFKDIKNAKCFSKENNVSITKNEAIAKPNDSLKIRIRLRKPKSEKKRKSTKSMKIPFITEARAGYSKQSKINNVQHSLKKDIFHSEKNNENTTSPSNESQSTIESCSPTNTAYQNNSDEQKDLESKINEIINNSVKQTDSKYIKPNIITSNNRNSLRRNVTENIDVTDLEKEMDISSILQNVDMPSEVKQFLINLETDHRETFVTIKQILVDVRKLYLKVHDNKKTLKQIVSMYRPTVPSEEQNQEDTKSEDTEENSQDIEMENQTEKNHQMTNSEDQIIQNSTFLAPKVTAINEINNNTKNTKWMLKYPHPGDGLVELVKKTGVYVSTNGLAKCKEKYFNVTTFARSLLDQVFTKKALETCSLIRTKYKKITRPPLYAPAKNAIIKYAVQHGQEVGWKYVNSYLLLNSLRNRLQEFRVKSMRNKLM